MYEVFSLLQATKKFRDLPWNVVFLRSVKSCQEDTLLLPTHLHYMPTFNILGIIMIFLSSQLDSSFSRAEMMFVDYYMLRVYENYWSIPFTVAKNKKSGLLYPCLKKHFLKSNMLCLQQLLFRLDFMSHFQFWFTFRISPLERVMEWFECYQLIQVQKLKI